MGELVGVAQVVVVLVMAILVLRWLGAPRVPGNARRLALVATIFWVLLVWGWYVEWGWKIASALVLAVVIPALADWLSRARRARR